MLYKLLEDMPFFGPGLFMLRPVLWDGRDPRGLWRSGALRDGHRGHGLHGEEGPLERPAPRNAVDVLCLESPLCLALDV